MARPRDHKLSNGIYPRAQYSIDTFASYLVLRTTKMPPFASACWLAYRDSRMAVTWMMHNTILARQGLKMGSC